MFTLLEELADLRLIGMDCLEVAPAHDHAELSAYAVARIVRTHRCGQLRRGGLAPC